MMHDVVLLGRWDQHEADALVFVPERSSLPILSYDSHEAARTVFHDDDSSRFIGDDGGDGDEVPEDVGCEEVEI